MGVALACLLALRRFPATIDVYVNVNPAGVAGTGASMEISGKVFIVTGAASGLREGTARMLVAHGAKVVLADLQEERGQAIAAELGQTFVRCDVTQEADGRRVVDAAKALGKLMGLVNCAGIAPAARTVGKTGPPALDLF